MMVPNPNEKKITQVVAHLLSRANGRMNHMKIVKLMYLAEREAIIRWGSPITFDRFYCLPHGPVLSRTLDMINGLVPESECAYWDEFIDKRVVHSVALLKPAEKGSLSDREVTLLDEVFNTHGHKDQWTLRDETHLLPEWRDPNGSALSFSIGDILRAVNRNPQEIEEIERELEVLALAENRLGARI
jgi:uncharacterized phage-associated protein